MLLYKKQVFYVFPRSWNAGQMRSLTVKYRTLIMQSSTDGDVQVSLFLSLASYIVNLSHLSPPRSRLLKMPNLQLDQSRSIRSAVEAVFVLHRVKTWINALDEGFPSVNLSSAGDHAAPGSGRCRLQDRPSQCPVSWWRMRCQLF